MKIQLRYKLFLSAVIFFFPAITTAQKGTADPGYYPFGYSGAIWRGEVTSFDNKHRTLTLTHTKGSKVQTFVATIPDAPYDQAKDDQDFSVIDFPFDKKATSQSYQYMSPGSGGAVILAPLGNDGLGRKSRPNPPAENIITDFSNFVGRRVIVFYTARERQVDGTKEKFNDVWRIKVYPKTK